MPREIAKNTKVCPPQFDQNQCFQLVPFSVGEPIMMVHIWAEL